MNLTRSYNRNIVGIQYKTGNIRLADIYKAKFVTIDFATNKGNILYYILKDLESNKKSPTSPKVFSKFIIEERLAYGAASIEDFKAISICYENIPSDQYQDIRPIIEKYKKEY